MPPRRSVNYTTPNLSLFVRSNERVNIGPPPRRTPMNCVDEQRTVILQLGKASVGREAPYNYKFDTTFYMTKQQREIIDENVLAED